MRAQISYCQHKPSLCLEVVSLEGIEPPAHRHGDLNRLVVDRHVSKFGYVRKPTGRDNVPVARDLRTIRSALDTSLCQDAFIRWRSS